jgi:thiamine kinase-like enzyme
MEEILDRLATELGAPDGSPVPLEGGITNRNWRARLGGVDYVLRVCSRETAVLGIDRDAECEASLRAAALAIGPDVAAFLRDDGVLVTRFLAGGPVPPERLRTPDGIADVAGALRAFHADAPLRATFWVPELVRRQAAALPEVPAALDPALALVERIAAALAGAEHERVPCHNDLLAANFVYHADGGVRIVDWEYAGMNDRYFDLANFSVNNELTEEQDRALLAAYFGEPPPPRRFAALRLMRIVSDLREAMWGTVQAQVSELDEDFAGYAARHFDRLAAAAGDPRVETWLEEARGAPA